MKGLKKIAYTDEFLYVEGDGYDIEIPLEKVKHVGLISLDGVYKFELYDEDQFGKAIYCKPSMWYPFNFSKIDRELEQIRQYIKMRKVKAWGESENQGFLASENR